MAKVFISYSQDNEEVIAKVKYFADALVENGLEVELDQYTPDPQFGWPDYMLKNTYDSDFVLCICTENYKLKFEHDFPEGLGKGGKFEGTHIAQRIYESEDSGNVIPVIIDLLDKKFIPKALKPYTYYCLNNKKSLEVLYAKLTGQEQTVKPLKGKITTPEKFAAIFTKTDNITEQYLLELQKDISDDIIRRLISNGVSEDCAKDILDEDIMSSDFDYIFINQDPIKYVIGDFGSGKTYALQILCLKDIRDSKHNVFPIFVKAKDFLEGDIDKFFEKNRVYNNDNVRLYIDGLDETSYDDANIILQYVQALARKNKNFTCVISSRPNFLTNNFTHAIYIKKFSKEKLGSLITKISGIDFNINFLYSYDEGIVQTICAPFFAIAFAVLLRNTKDIRIPKKGDLINKFVNLSIRTGIENKKIETYLMIIASNYIDNEMISLEVEELDESIDLNAVLKTGYINIRNSKIDFPLPIIAQWFGAKAIKSKIKDIDDIISSDANIIRWRYCLSILFSNLSFNESKNFVAKIVQTYPGVASRCFQDSMGYDMKTSLPKADKCGEMMRYCFEVWKESLGDLAKKVIPIKSDKINTLFVGTDNKFLQYAIGLNHYGNDFEIITSNDYVSKCHIIHNRMVPDTPLWPWIITFEYIKNNLTQSIKNKTLFVDDNDLLADEYLWEIGKHLIKQGSLYDGDVPLSVLEVILQSPCALQVGCRKFIVTTKLLSRIKEKQLLGLKHISYSTIPHNKTISGGYVWDSYTKDRLFEKAKDVYEKAFNIYIDLLSKHCFGSIEKNLSFKIIQPAKLVAQIRYTKNSFPAIYYYFLAQAIKTKSSVDVTFVEDRKSNQSIEILNIISEALKTNHPLNYEFASAYSTDGILEIFNEFPISGVVYKWIEDDLKRINWLN